MRVPEGTFKPVFPPVSDEDKAKMLQVRDLAATILFVASMPASVCANEFLIRPTWNRAYTEGVL